MSEQLGGTNKPDQAKVDTGVDEPVDVALFTSTPCFGKAAFADSAKAALNSPFAAEGLKPAPVFHNAYFDPPGGRVVYGEPIKGAAGLPWEGLSRLVLESRQPSEPTAPLAEHLADLVEAQKQD